MDKSNRYEKFMQLRKELPVFTYEGYDFSCGEHGLDIRFHFNLAGKYHFYPKTFIPQKSFFLPTDELMDLLPSLVFHLGLIELISYWKAACPPQVIVKPHHLSPEQVAWWKKIWFHGLGEFFYLNTISTDIDNFMKVDVASEEVLPLISRNFQPEVIIPVGGGKDSIVTLELTRKRPGTTPLILNPRGASIHSIFMAGYAHSGMFGIHRVIDPLLLQLNDQGFLNGHTPFSALLAFLSVLASVVTGKKYIALSNESSANEPTIPGKEINHQYSKTIGFETNFREYITRFISPEIDYFSFLRPLNEIQIAGLFSRYPKYFPVFKSCNVGSKTDSWCGKCPKCLFTYIMLAPFLKPEELSSIFRKNLLQDALLKPVFDQLIGLAPEKPFDCIGTVAEVNAALAETLSRYGDTPLPWLLEYYAGLTGLPPTPPGAFGTFLIAWDPHHFLPPDFEALLKGAIYG
ncbi:MAG: hypothetical protein V1733_03630 [bacterium]